MILNKRQIRQLKSMATTLESKYQVGKNGITGTLIEILDKGIEKHELIKISLMKCCMPDKKEIANELANKLHAELITIVGGVIVLYRKNLKEPKITLVD